MEVAEHRGNNWRNPEDSQARHRRFKEQRGEIVRCAEAWGRRVAMDKFDIRCESTMDRLLHKAAKAKGDGHEPIHLPLVNTRESYPNSESHYDGLVRALARHLREQDDKNALLEAAYLFEREKNHRLEEEKAHWRLTAKGVEDEVMTELLVRINTT